IRRRHVYILPFLSTARHPPTSPLFPYTTLFRSRLAGERLASANAGSSVEGVYAFPHPFGCGQLGDDLKNTQKVLAGLIRHPNARSEEHTSELQSRSDLVCRLLLEKKKFL